MYHSIGQRPQDEAGAELYSVSEERFKEQIGYLFFQKPGSVITFDDGYEDNYTVALPILQKTGIKAYFFIIPSKIGTPGYMTWAEVREMRDRGMTIGSHGMTHRILTPLRNGELDYELRESKNMLEDNLGHNISYFSIPRGFYNKRVINRALEAGYRIVFTSDPKDRGIFRYGRIAVKGDWDIDYFDKVVNNKIPLVDKGERAIIDTAKKILGTRVYDKVRTSVLNGK